MLIEDGPQQSRARQPAPARDPRLDQPEVEHPLGVCAVERALDHAPRLRGRDVEEGPSEAGGREVVPDGDVLRTQGDGTVNPQPAPPTAPAAPWHGEMHARRRRGQHAPERRRRAMTQHCGLARRQEGDPVVRGVAEVGVPDGVDAARDTVQAPGAEPTVDRAAAQADREELGSGDDAALAGGDRGDLMVRGEFAFHMNA
ncbi:hypothetical protein LRS13_12990 [Svornostia abyssi]|uniref:Uncharacterized protein n=1 Tax=Svornostia abyssi TaxID=2898438 RepID=A0ABY5PAK4_9ACTN|nr:hypothetical protein LRS13_12990 [Parviterribacteraceae bacterium J379]